MAWRQLTFALRAADLDRAEALLRLAGAVAVTLADEGDEPVFEPPPGAIELWPRVQLTALFDDAVDPAAVASLIETTIDIGRVSTTDLTDDDWRAGWEQAIVPLTIAPNLTIAPAEEPVGDPASTVRIGMGLAFGTGRHPTTRLCLEWIASHDVQQQRVCDFGCGSGILALAALCRGARHAVATDNDEQALIATRANAELNGWSDRIEVLPPDRLPSEDSYDLLLANILAGTLGDLADRLAALQRPGGDLVLSGILPAQAPTVISHFASHYEGFETAESEGWVRLRAHRV